jgi:hypothetical protein
MKRVKQTRSGKSGKSTAKIVRIGDVDVLVATPAGKPKHRSAAAIRAAVRAHMQSVK